MRNTLRLLAITALAAVGVAVTAGTASAAPTGGGYDISYPQCSTTPPTGQAWGVVGVNGGLATTANPCLSTQLQYILATSRFAHYLKVIMRDKVGSFMTREDCETYLNRWMNNYVVDPKNVGQAEKARRPHNMGAP